ncbi:unnamed protein product [Ambrosiozyma monospora]|uniref:Unnamed protein product n=1 Tax=Ambrosiozyma monospora TaxID=43982 RepID=A0ACB5SVR4_AMBMO|nr:unnamed protein product [Ambrosiozyma monospora]
MSFNSEKKPQPQVEVTELESSTNLNTNKNSDFDFNTETQRGLKQRHIQIIALAGAIGTGLFVGSGSGLSTCGPAGLLTGYAILCIFIWFVMNQLAEMVTYIPTSGKATMYALCERYTGNRSLSFTAGLNLFYAQALIVPTEITAASFVIQYWNDKINVAAWISIFWVSIVALNMLAVGVFGEVEFWIGSIKLITATGLIILGVVLFFGGGPDQHGVLGFHYWNHPGAFVEHLVPGNTGKFLACWTSIIKAGFAFVLSPELITCAAAESEHPRHNLPKATKRFIYRLIFFYFFGPLVIGIIVASNDARLMSAIASGSSGAAASPFVIGIQNAGIKVLNHIVNAVILTSAYSCGNSMLFASSRTLHSMAIDGQFPKIFAKCTPNGIPIYAVALSSAIALVAYLNVSNSSTIVFTWLSNISTISGFISWILVGITYLRYRKAMIFHGMEDKVVFRPPLQVFGAWASIIFFSLITLTNGYAVFFDWNTANFFAAYITLPIVFVLYVGHMIWSKNYRLFAPPEEIDCFTGLEAIESEAATYEPRKPKNFLQRIWFWIA